MISCHLRSAEPEPHHGYYGYGGYRGGYAGYGGWYGRKKRWVGSSAGLLHKTWHSGNVLDGTDIVLLTQILYTKYKVKERLPLE